MKPVVLIILDGWGIAPPGPGNAVSLANLKNIPSYWTNYPHAHIEASGEAVGLPAGEDGNTETGHMNLGAGRVVYQDYPRINMAIANEVFYKNKAFHDAFAHARHKHSNVHIMGLVSDSAVHSSLNHLYALLEYAKREGVHDRVYLHLFSDGRDSPTNSAKRFFAEIDAKLVETGVGKIATVMGRYYSMDRDRRWERTEKAYIALTLAPGRTAPDAVTAIDQAYARNETDEFIEPTGMVDEKGQLLPRIANNDAVIFFNFRIDRPRQLTKAFVLQRFEEEAHIMAFDPYAVKYFHKHTVDSDMHTKPFKRNVILTNLFFVTMTEYERNMPCHTAFPPEILQMTLGEVLAKSNLRQLRVAETEKERFVTYYFNGLREEPFSGEDRLMVPSPKVSTYDLQPEMAANELTKRVLDRLSSGVYSFTLINFANADMVAHTGNIPAATRACELIDGCVKEIVDQVLAVGGTCVITADHGNVEEMIGPNGETDTEHSTFPVPFIAIDKAFASYPNELPQGKLADIATTVLFLLGIPIPKEMTGINLLATLPITPAEARPKGAKP